MMSMIDLSMTTSIVLFVKLGFGSLAQLLNNIVDIALVMSRDKYFFGESRFDSITLFDQSVL